jgi:Cu(I)/Ag(I) efflux system membrane fusion protein
MNKLMAVVLLIAGAGGGYWFAHYQQPAPATMAKATRPPLYYRSAMNPAATSAVPAKDTMGMDYVAVYADDEAAKTPKILYYRNPMNPAVTAPTPRKDDMGMDYVPVYADDETDTAKNAGLVKIDAQTVQNMGVRTAAVTRTTLHHIVHAVGRVAYDEERIVRLHPKTEGWIEAIWANKTGQQVKANDALLSIYSPQLVSSQQEYLLALNTLTILQQSPIAEIRQGAQELVNSSKERLKWLDVPAHQLHELERSHNINKSLHIHTPVDGTIIEIGAREGQYVTSDTQLYMIADLTKVWVYADIYEYELPWINVGDPVEMRLAGIPEQVFKGHAAFIYPYAEAKTRTIKVRLVFDNAPLLLKPDMFTEVTIQAGKQENALVVPIEAVVRSGADNQVFIALGGGKFEPRTVKTGLSSDGQVAVLAGLKEGEQIVTSAQFLIDSESNLREATAKMLTPDVQALPRPAPNP